MAETGPGGYRQALCALLALKHRAGAVTYSITYTEPLYAIVTLDRQGAVLKGKEAQFVPPTPEDLGMNDSVGVFPLVSCIKDLTVKF